MTGKEMMEQLRASVKRREFLRKIRAKIHMDIDSSGIDYSADRVQSTAKDPMFEEACRMLERLQEIDTEIIQLSESINRAVDLIRKIPFSRPAETLFKRYYTGQKLNKIADEMGYSYAQVKRYHAEGLKELEAIIPKKNVLESKS